MRVLIAVHNYPPTYTTGAEREAERTARGLLSLGHEVGVLTVEGFAETGPPVTFDDQIQDGVLVRRLTLGPHDVTGNEFQHAYDNSVIGAAVAEMIDDWRPDLFHLFSGYLMSSSAVQVAITRCLPVVVTLTDYWWMCHRITLLRTDGSRCDGPTPAGCARCQAETFRRYRLPTRVFPPAASWFWETAGRKKLLGDHAGLPAQSTRRQTLLSALSQVDALIAPSQFLADRYVEWGIDREDIRVWRQGVELDVAPPRVPSESLRVGYLGQIKSHKGVQLLVDAWSRLHGPRARTLTIYGSAAGEPAYGDQIRAQVDQLEDATWPGEFRGSDVWQILSNIDVLVVPSRWVENSPNTIMEAQAVGIPVIGSNLGGIAEMVQHEQNGLLFEVDDSVGLASQLQRLLDEPDLLPQLQRNPMPYQTVQQTIALIDGLYHTLLRQGSCDAVAMG